jgi:hypothetical protein
MALDSVSFTFGSLTDATSDATSDALNVEYDHVWSVECEQTGVSGGSPTYTLEVCNDNASWKSYSTDVENITLDTGVDGNYFAWKYVRVNYTAGGTSAGTIEFTITFKDPR